MRTWNCHLNISYVMILSSAVVWLLMDSSGLLFGILSNAGSRKKWGYVLVQLLIHPLSALSAQLSLELFCLRQLWLCKKKKKRSIFVIFHIILYATHWHMNEREWTLRYLCVHKTKWTKCAWYVIFGPYVLSWRSTKWRRDVYIYTFYILFYSVLVIKLYFYKSY